MHQEKSRLKRAIRSFFDQRDYIEMDTPILSPTLIPETGIEVFKTCYEDPYRQSRELFLVPSPEVFMKPFIAASRRSVYQICHCFRNCEAQGRIHSPEFTMLEYYTVGIDAQAAIGLTEELFDAILPPGAPPALRPPFRLITMAEAFKNLANMDLLELQDRHDLISACRDRGLALSDDSSWEDAFNIAFLSLVETRLPQDKPLVLGDFPAQIECLAAPKAEGPWKQRWELYALGMELANTYTEAASESEVRAIMRAQAQRKMEGARVPHPVDPDYPLFFRDFPLCSGVALGLDRLLMGIVGAKDIREVQ